jgi:class 3 adenylate cyclase/tetratricopeptide (TPR) repeat protein
MRCPACQHESPEGSRFCNGCGERLDVMCVACQQANPPGSRFCNACGANLGEAPAPSGVPAEASWPEAASDPRAYTPRHLAERILGQKSALEGERKHVTVLFADLADSTALVERVGDPEEMHRLMDRAFQQMLEQVHRYEGTVNQFTGDGVMALFGAPLALEDAPRRAIVAALAIQRALAPLDAEVQARYGHRFRMRIGIHAGPVVVGTIGDDLRMDYTAVGDTTNLAARLESLAGPGQVLISETAKRLAEGFFDLSPLEPVQLKGFARAVHAWEVHGARPVAGRIEVLSESADGLTAYVGRERELDALLAAFDQAKAGRGQVAFVVGEAGLGKSRLVHEFRQRIAGEQHLWVEGHCASFAHATPFHAVADAMRRLNDIDDRDDENAALEKLLGRQSELGADLDWTVPYMRVLLSLPSGSPEVDALDAMSRRAEMCRALHARMVRVTERMPEVIVVEDMHWVDAATEEFLAFVSDTIGAAPVLMILTHRPGYVHAFGDRSYHVRVPLQPLSESAMSSMAGSVLETGELPPALRRLIASKAEGNPLFVEELTTSLLEEGVLALEQGRAVLTRDLADVTIPDRIQDVLMARLDRLPEKPKRAIQMASVIGREFAMRLLSRIHDVTEGLEEIVGELRSLELIYEKAAHPELAYMFKHALTHEVAYESLLVARRKTLHRVVGTAIEELYRDRIAEHYEALAYHFAESEDHERALRYHELASEKSASTYANHAAIEHCRKALEEAALLGDVDTSRLYALHLRLGECCWMVSDFGGSGEGFVRAAELASDPADAALLMGRGAFSHLWNHDYPTYRRTIERAFELTRSSGSKAAQAFAVATEDEFEMVQGRRLADDSEIVRAISLAEEANDEAVLVLALGQAAQRAEWSSDFRSAIAHGESAIALAESYGRPGDSLFASWFMAIAAVCLGDYARGLEVMSSGIALCDRIGDRAIQARLLNTLGWAHAELGCHERAAQLNRAATQMAREAVDLGLVAGAPELYANGAINLAGNLTALGRTDEAEEHLAAIARQHEADPDPWMRWRWSVHLADQQARLALARGETERALELARVEIEAAERTPARRLACRAHELLGRVLLTMDDRESAQLALERALAVAVEIEHPSVACRAHSLLAELARRRGEGALAESHLGMVRRAFGALAPGVPDPELRREFLGLGDRLVSDPLGPSR